MNGPFISPDVNPVHGDSGMAGTGTMLDHHSGKATPDKKLLFICHSYNTFQKDSIDGLSRYFNRIQVLVRTNPFAEISRFLPVSHLDRFKKSTKIDLLDSPPNVSVLATPVWYLPLDRSYKSLGDKHFCSVKKAIKEHHLTFDLIHAHFTWSAGYAGARLREEYGIPFVVTGHGYDVYSLPFRDDEWQKKIAYVLNTADHIITVSKSNRECIKKLHVTTPVTIIPNGFRRDLFHPADPSGCRARLNLPGDRKILLAVGNLEPVKGLSYLLTAVKEIVRERTDILCVIVGRGVEKHALETQVRALDLERYVLFAGGKPHNEIPLWINACDIFVLPSLNEGNPTVMFEALGCGKPFVGTRVGGVPEIITSEDYGLLVTPADAGDLAEKIKIALDREWDREKILGYAARYTWETIAKEIVEVYRQVSM